MEREEGWASSGGAGGEGTLREGLPEYVPRGSCVTGRYCRLRMAVDHRRRAWLDSWDECNNKEGIAQAEMAEERAR